MGTYGTVGNYNCSGALVFPLTLNQNTCSTSPNNGMLQSNKLENRHTLMTDKTAMDPNTNANNPVSCVAPANMFPAGTTNNYSFRIGNGVGEGNATVGSGGEALAESISHTFIVTKQNAGLTYMYAAFLLESNPAHFNFEAPRFEIKITHKVNGKDELIDCGYYNVDVGDGNTNNFLDGAPVTNGNWKYTRWTKVGLDLTAYIGQSVTIEFTTADCFPKKPGSMVDGKCSFKAGGHSAYAYIDLYCTPVEIVSPNICANVDSVDICGPDGYAAYEWEPGPGIDGDLKKKCITIKNPKAGDTYTVNMKSLAGNCPNSTTFTLLGNDFTIENVATCPGNTVKLSPKPVTGTVADYDWKWEPQVNLDNYNIAEPTFTPGATTTYTVTMIDRDIKNCNQVKYITVTVGAGYTVKTANATICEGGQTTLTATGADSYTWEPGGLTGSTVTVNPTVTTTYTVTGKLNNSICEGDAKANATVTVNKKPIVATTPQTICAGESAKLSATVTGGSTTGRWIGGNGTFTPGRNVLTATYTPTSAEETAGTVTLTLESDAPKAPCVKDSKTLTITIVPVPSVSAGADQTICFGESAKLTGTMDNATVATWSGGNGTFTPNNTTLTATYTPTAAEMADGTVTLTLTTNANGQCPAKDDEMTIRINPVAVVDAGPDQTICANGSATLAAVVSGSATSGVWSGGTGNYSPSNSVVNPTYTPSLAEQTAGKVVLTFTSNDPVGPCPAVNDEMTIFIDQLPVAIAGETKAICDGQQIQLEGSVKNTTGGVWSEGTGTFKKDNTDLTGTYIPSAQEIIAGKVTLILTSNTNGLCPSHKDTVTFTINPNPVIDFSVNIPKACPDHCVNFTDLTTVGGNTKIDKWIWNFSIDSSKIQHPTNICFVKPGFYDVSLTAISDAGCKSSLTKPQFIETYPEPTAAFRVNPTSASIYDPSFNFYNQSSLDVVSWTWNLGDGKIISPKIQNPSHTYELGVSGTYTIGLFVANNYGCVDTTYRNVEVLPEFTFFIPNAFTPYRNDGTNDTFFGKGVGIIAYHIWIFDRWGNMVFDTTDINHGWDGRANGGQDIAQQDVFVWKVKLTDIFNRKHDYIGTVTLVR